MEEIKKQKKAFYNKTYLEKQRQKKQELNEKLQKYEEQLNNNSANINTTNVDEGENDNMHNSNNENKDKMNNNIDNNSKVNQMINSIVEKRTQHIVHKYDVAISKIVEQYEEKIRELQNLNNNNNGNNKLNNNNNQNSDDNFFLSVMKTLILTSVPIIPPMIMKYSDSMRTKQQQSQNSPHPNSQNITSLSSL